MKPDKLLSMRHMCERSVINAKSNSALRWAALKVKEIDGSKFAAAMLEQAAIGAGLSPIEAKQIIRTVFEEREYGKR
jgi:hypothetical protein